MAQFFLNRLPAEMIWEVCKNLNLTDIINLKSTNKYLHDIIFNNKKLLMRICQHQNIYVFLGSDKENFFPALLGEYYYQQAEKISEKIYKLNASFDELRREYWHSSVSGAASSEAAQKHILKEKSNLQQEWLVFIEKAMASGHVLATFLRLSGEVTNLYATALNNNNKNYIELKRITELNLQLGIRKFADFKNNYGDIIDCFLAEYLIHLLENVNAFLKKESHHIDGFVLTTFGESVGCQYNNIVKNLVTTIENLLKKIAAHVPDENQQHFLLRTLYKDCTTYPDIMHRLIKNFQAAVNEYTSPQVSAYH